MRNRQDLVEGWIRKAESDLANAALCIERGIALDTACFHSQQAAEKYLKAYLTSADIRFPFIHDLDRLVELCTRHEDAFRSIRQLAVQLTPYAVALRYDDDFWPTIDETRDAYSAATAIKRLVIERLPSRPDR